MIVHVVDIGDHHFCLFINNSNKIDDFFKIAL